MRHLLSVQTAEKMVKETKMATHHAKMNIFSYLCILKRKKTENARDKTKQSGTTAAKGTQLDIPKPDTYDARYDGKRNEGKGESRPQRMHRILEHIPL